MFKNQAINPSYKYTIWFTVTCFITAAALILLSRYADGFAQWYAVNLYPVFPVTIGRAFSVWNASFFEAGILAVFFIALIMLFTGSILSMFSSPFKRTFRFFWIKLLLCSLAGLTLMYTLTCAINYQRDGIGTVMKLPAAAVSKENLINLNKILISDMINLTNDTDWDYSLLSAKEPDYIETEAINSMSMLGNRELSLSGYYSRPKPVFFSEFLSALGIEGIFSPFTLEANYNKAMTSFLLPYTICHELAHQKGYMKEEDAGFIAYLACKNSSSEVFQYSGLFHALIFSLNALKAETTAEEFNEIYGSLPEQIKLQLIYIKERSSVQSATFKAATKKVNNLYLTANAQSGTKSYGDMVDLLIAEYADRLKGAELL